MTVINESEPPLTDKEIEIIHKRLGYKLPDEYRQFLQVSNGGVPSPDAVRHDGEYYDYVSCFYAVRNNAYSNDLFVNIEEYKDLILSHYLPIGDSPGGNVYCISLKAEDFGAVYFWDHDEANYEGEPWEFNMTLLSPSFNKFIESLYSES